MHIESTTESRREWAIKRIKAKNDFMPNRIVRISLLIFDALTCMAALAGGIALVTGAEANRFPAEWLGGTPFSDYVVPALILALIVGGSAGAAFVGILVRARTGAALSVLAGCILMGWIGGELVLLRSAESRSGLEAVYFGIGLLMTALGLIYLRSAVQASDGLRTACRSGRASGCAVRGTPTCLYLVDARAQTGARGATPVRVLLVDDHAVLRRGMRALLEREPCLEVVGAAEDGEHAAERLRPDVILMDLQMRGMDGIEATRQITSMRPQTRVVVC